MQRKSASALKSKIMLPVPLCPSNRRRAAQRALATSAAHRAGAGRHRSNVQQSEMRQIEAQHRRIRPRKWRIMSILRASPRHGFRRRGLSSSFVKFLLVAHQCAILASETASRAHRAGAITSSSSLYPHAVLSYTSYDRDKLTDDVPRLRSS